MEKVNEYYHTQFLSIEKNELYKEWSHLFQKEYPKSLYYLCT